MESVGSIILYFIVALSMIVFSAMAVTTRKFARSHLPAVHPLRRRRSLLHARLRILGAVQIAVYAGGIVVLFVFAILLTSRPGDNSERLTSKSRVLGAVAAIATLVITGYALISRVSVALAPKPEMQALDMQQLGSTLMGTGDGQYLLPFEAVSVLLLACIIGGVVVARKR